MSKLQGFIKPIHSTTLRIWRRERDEIELAWDGQDILLYQNGNYLRKITETPTVQIEVWDSTRTYLAGDNFVSYKSPNYDVLPENDPFKEEYIYRCVENTNLDESPETHPDKWLRQGKVGEQGVNTIFLSDVNGLEEALNNRIKYTDLSDEFVVDSNNRVSLNIDYITLSDYSPAEGVQPDPIEEVQIGNTIWKASNETWTDGGSGIFSANGDSNNDSVYGLLYDFDAVERLLAANPGYRLPTYIDLEDLIKTYNSSLIWNTNNQNMFLDSTEPTEIKTFLNNSISGDNLGDNNSYIDSGLVAFIQNNLTIPFSGYARERNAVEEYISFDIRTSIWTVNTVNFIGSNYSNLFGQFTIQADRVEITTSFSYFDAIPVRLVKDI